MAHELPSSKIISSEICNSKTINDSSQPSSSTSEWRKKAVIFWFSCLILSGAIIWALLMGSNSSKIIVDKLGFSEENNLASENHLKIRSKQFPSLTSLFSGMDQAFCLWNHGFREPNRKDKDPELKGQCPIGDKRFFPKFDSMSTEKKLPDSFDSEVLKKDLCVDHKVRILTEDHHRVWLTIVEACGYAGAVITFVILCGAIVYWRKEDKRNMHIESGSLRGHHLLLLKQHQSTHQAPRRFRNWQKKLLVMCIFLGIMFSLWLFLVLYKKTTLKREETLKSMCKERAQMLQEQFNVSINQAHTLATMLSTFHHSMIPSVVNQMNFAEYTRRTSLESPLISGIAYAVKVLHSERASFERELGWIIKKSDFDDQTLVQDWILDKLHTAPPQEEYAPVIFTQTTISDIISIDMMSRKEDRETIFRARATGKGALTSPFKFLKSSSIGVVLTIPVYDKDVSFAATSDERIQACVGYLGVSFDVPSFVETLLEQFPNTPTVVVDLYDTTNPSSPLLMYNGGDIFQLKPYHASQLDFGDPLRRYEIQCRFKQKAPLPWNAIYPSAIVLVIVLLVGHIFYIPIKRIAQAEAGYWEMLELKIRAEAADVAKSQFLATISHEIRTPMNGVLGMLQMLMDTELTDLQKDYARIAHFSGKELISLINDVLDQAKIESGKLELESVPFNLHSALDGVVSLSSTRSNEKGIELAVYVSEHVPEFVIGDPARFRQIIQNLVGNSIKFTPDNGGHIFVTVHLLEEISWGDEAKNIILKPAACDTLSGFPVVDRTKSWGSLKEFSTNESDTLRLLVTVEDTGIGISKESHKIIFTPFVQGDSSTSRTYGGTGIGLSISKCLVDLMNGDIGFHSEANVGSTFSFVASFKSVLSDTKFPHHLSVPDLKGCNALIVDNRIIRSEVTKYHLRKLGISADSVPSLKSACSFLSSNSDWTRFVMILIEKEVWEEEDGFMLQRIVKLRTVHIPKIVVLANEQCVSKLWDIVVLKPLRASVLLSCFQDVGSKKVSESSKKKFLPLRKLLEGKRILIVDDNMVNRKVAEGALKKHGAIITCVSNGLEAVKLLNPPHDFDACFMDKRMPEMDGLEATREIRGLESLFNDKIENEAKWHVPILAMTADSIQGTNEECFKCGMDDFVSKPFDEEQLYFALSRIFSNS